MKKRIKVVGYIYPDDVDPTWIDLDHPSGLSVIGFERLWATTDLDNMDFALEDDDE